MIEILAATTGVASLGVGWLAWLVRRKGQESAQALSSSTAAHESLMAALREEAAKREEYNRTLLRGGEERRALSELLEAECDKHNAAVAALEAAHALEVAGLKGEITATKEANLRAAFRLEVLLGGHDFHVGGKVVSHGREQILYNCVSCSPDTNVRVIAPEGFFGGS